MKTTTTKTTYTAQEAARHYHVRIQKLRQAARLLEIEGVKWRPGRSVGVGTWTEEEAEVIVAKAKRIAEGDWSYSQVEKELMASMELERLVAHLKALWIGREEFDRDVGELLKR